MVSVKLVGWLVRELHPFPDTPREALRSIAILLSGGKLVNLLVVLLRSSFPSVGRV